MKRRTQRSNKKETPAVRALAICRKLTRDLSAGRIGDRIKDRLHAEQIIQRRADQNPDLRELLLGGSQKTLSLAGF